jgi:ribosomal protein S25
MMSKTDNKVDSVKKLVPENRGITVREVANMLGILSGLVHGILKDNLNVSD